MDTHVAPPTSNSKTAEPPLNIGISIDDVKLPNMDVDRVLHYLGRFGRYQALQLALLHLCIAVNVLPILHGMFVGKNADFRCAEDEVSFQMQQPLSTNQTVVYSQCHIEIQDNITSDVLHKEACRKYDYNGGDEFLTYIAEWDLVCDKEVSGQLPQMLVLIGQMFGAIVFPQIGDRFGRKKLTIAAIVVQFLVMGASALVKDYEFFLVLRFLIGASIQAAMVPLMAMILEILPANTRAWMIIVNAVCWSSSMITTGIMGYLLQNKDWRTLQLAYALMGGIPSIVAIFFLDESLRWLAGNSRVEELETLLRKACRWNKKDFGMLLKNISDTKKESQPINGAQSHQDKQHLEETSCKPVDVVKHKNSRKITFISCFAWMVASLSYYGILLNSTSLSGDPYVNYFLAAVVEVPAGIAAFFVLKSLRRKPSAIGLSIGSASALLLAVLVANVAPSQPAFANIKMCFILIGQFFLIDLFTLLWLYTTELYPTNLRAIGVGTSSAASRFGSSFAPLFTILARKVPWAPGALFAGGCLISAFLFTMLPETLGVPLPNTLKDVDNLFQKSTKKNKPLSPQIYQDVNHCSEERV